MVLPPAPADEAERLATLRRYGVLGTPPETAFTRLAELARAALGTAGVLLSFLGERRVFYKAQRGLGVPSYPRLQALCGYAALGDEPLVLADAQADPEAAALAFVRRNGVRFYAGVPLRSPEGAPLGALSVFDPQPHTLSEAALRSLAEHAGAVLDLLEARRAALAGTGRRSRAPDSAAQPAAEPPGPLLEGHRAALLEQVARGAPLPAVLLELTRLLETALPGRVAAVFSRRDGALQLEVGPGLPNTFSRLLGSLPLAAAASPGAAALSGERVVTPDIRRDPRWGGLRYFALQSGLEACWAEPLLGDEGGDQGVVLGVLALYARQPATPTEAELRTLREAAHLAAVAVSRARLYRRLERQAHYDALTGLPNRNLLQDHLGRALAQAGGRGEEVGVLLVNLDDFKRINDVLGHRMGDRLLAAVAARLGERVPPRATLARGDGDEFLVALPLEQRSDAARLAFELTEAFVRPFEVGGRTVTVAAGIGVSLYPEDGALPETLLKAADAAMRAVKADRRAGGRQGYRLYQRTMTAALEAERQLEADLLRALQGDELRLFVQPRFGLTEGGVCAYEALVRWAHPERGLLLPGAFIEGAQRAGLLPQLDAWVLREAVGWLTGPSAGAAWRLSCNVSAASFQSTLFLAVLEETLGRGRAVAERLELEITENLLMQNLGDTALQLAGLKERFPGIRVAIDDFGSGYSSLSYLRQLPIDTLKIDRAFVQDLDHRDARLQRTALAVIRTVIALGRDLGFRIVAEGAETEGQLGMLTALGVDEVQGFVLGYPRPLSEVVTAPPPATLTDAERR